MVKFLFPCRAIACAQTKSYRCGNHARSIESARRTRCVPAFKILIEFNFFKIDENSRRIRIDFAQKPRFNANDSFKPVCYGLVQRRRNSRRG
jgi:hypothetical protein